MRVFVTGSAGFIGFHLARRLLSLGHEVMGYDGLTDYYDVRLKSARLALLEPSSGFCGVTGMIEDKDLLRASLTEFRPDVVLHFAAQAGVRYSLEHPETYLSSNVTGLLNLLEVLRHAPGVHLIFASSSSVYGANATTSYTETERTDFPLSIYASTKRGAEALTHSYAHLFAIPTTVLRLFTVYGPWGRPDMAAIKFASAIERGEPIEIYGNGKMTRDFTFITDVVDVVTRLLPLRPVENRPAGAHDSLSPVAPWRAVNVAGGKPVELLEFIVTIEHALGKSARHVMLPMQPGDVVGTSADTRLLRALAGYVPNTPLVDGIAAFADWYRAEWPRFQT